MKNKIKLKYNLEDEKSGCDNEEETEETWDRISHEYEDEDDEKIV